MPTYYPISEETARTANMVNSFREYRPNSATEEYRAHVDEAAALVAERKEKLSPFYHAKLDGLLESYSKRLAAWYNDYYRNEASCPSVMISGGSNFPVRKKEKQNSRRDTLMKEREEIDNILHRIKAVGTGGVDLADPDARQELNEQLARHKELLETAKAANAYYRKHKTLDGCPGIPADYGHSVGFGITYHGSPFPAYELQSIRGKIKRIESRLADLDKLEAAKACPAADMEFDGGRLVKNAEENRLQIIFDNVPDAATRKELKDYGFRWSPRNQAWQRQLTRNAEYDAKKLMERLGLEVHTASHEEPEAEADEDSAADEAIQSVEETAQAQPATDEAAEAEPAEPAQVSAEPEPVTAPPELPAPLEAESDGVSQFSIF